MPHPALVFLIGIGMIGCNSSPTEPPPGPEPSPPFGRLHGTWVTAVQYVEYRRASFDSVSKRFCVEWLYSHGFKRELWGTYLPTDSRVAFTYDYGSTDYRWYRVEADSLAISFDSTLLHTFSHIRTSPEPAALGFSVKLIPIRQTLGLNAYYDGLRMSFAMADDGPVALVTVHQPTQRELVLIDSTNGIMHMPLSNNPTAIDALGPALWMATDSLIQKRLLRDTTILQSISIGTALLPGDRVTSLAVTADRFYVVADNASDQLSARLLTFANDGTLLASVRTTSVVHELCAVGDRLFCSVGTESFYELDLATGFAKQYYSLTQAPLPFGTVGLAFHKGNMYVLDYPTGGWRLSEVAVPTSP